VSSDCSERTFCSKKGEVPEGCSEFDNGEFQFHTSPSIMLIKSRKVKKLNKREDKKKNQNKRLDASRNDVTYITIAWMK